MRAERETQGFPAAVLAANIKEFKSRLVRVDCPPALQERITHILHGEGKYIRPVLLLSFCHLVGYKEDNSIDAALAVEYVHAASLIHDDIIDEASVRRGRTSTHKKWNVKEALLAGDFLYARAFELIGKLGCEQATSVLAAAVARLSLGELRELASASADPVLPKREDYYRMIYDKTAVLFGACCEIAALLGKREKLCASAKKFGDEFGMAFQLRDDMLDYIADCDDGSETLQDLAQGKITLPLIRAYEIADNTEQEEIRAAMREIVLLGTADKIPDDKRRLLARLIAKPAVIEYLQQQMRVYLDSAEEQLRYFADGEVRSSLLGLIGMLSNNIPQNAPQTIPKRIKTSLSPPTSA